MKSIIIIVIHFVFYSICSSQEYFDLHETMMKSTYKISSGKSIGTGFIVAKPITSDSIEPYRTVLVTATHVLNSFTNKKMNIHFRKKSGQTYVKFVEKIDLEKNNSPIWVRHPDVDVAALYIDLPSECDRDIISTHLLVNDKILKMYEISAGYQVYALGFPFGAESNNFGFPILRTGTIASYPIIPTFQIKKFLVDFEVFPGNSGGPVYIIQRGRSYIKGGDMGIVKYRFVMGLVSTEVNIQEQIQSMYESRLEKHPLKIAEVIHASLILETINSLP